MLSELKKDRGCGKAMNGLDIKTNPWLKYMVPKPSAKLRLFCFPHAGGAASFFRTWSCLLGEQIEILPVQLPGRENRLSEPNYTSMKSLVEDLAEVIFPYLNLPFAFFGHSMGALISFELASHLQRLGNGNPEWIFLSACRSPATIASAQKLSGLKDTEFIEEFKKLEGLPGEILDSYDAMEFFLPIIRSDVRLFESFHYRGNGPVCCGVTVLGGEDDHTVSAHELESWRQYTSGEFDAHHFKGKHFYINANLCAIIRIIKDRLIIQS
ncbi:MAG: thioesterase [Spirochaetales bacterium]|nr:thioesterase [Spirochaetales bacterium]